jgi:hypothetical protein
VPQLENTQYVPTALNAVGFVLESAIPNRGVADPAALPATPIARQATTATSGLEN